MVCFGSLDGTWSAPLDVFVTDQSILSPQIAMDPSGNATATWSNLTLSRPQAASKPFDSSWETVQTLSQIYTQFTGSIVVSVVVDTRGNATAV
jgi:hypothetical protein